MYSCDVPLSKKARILSSIVVEDSLLYRPDHVCASSSQQIRPFVVVLAHATPPSSIVLPDFDAAPFALANVCDLGIDLVESCNGIRHDDQGVFGLKNDLSCCDGLDLDPSCLYLDRGHCSDFVSVLGSARMVSLFF